MQLKPRVMDPRAKDEISEALAYMVTPDGGGTPYRVVPAYLVNHYPDGLKARTIGAESRKLVGVTRYYPKMTPRVVVDFEPDPRDGPFWEQEKRRFFSEQGIVYVPVYLGDKMDESGFQERVAACTALMAATRSDHYEDTALAGAVQSTEAWLQNQELMAAIDARCLQLLAEEEADKDKKFNGMAKVHVLRRIKRAEVETVRRGLKNGSIVDPLGRYRQLAAAAQ